MFWEHANYYFRTVQLVCIFNVLEIAIKCPYNDPDQPVPLVVTNGQFLLPRCGTLMFTTASHSLLSKWSCFLDNRLSPPTLYKRECSNTLALLITDCSFFYFDELVTYYALSCSASLWNLTQWSCNDATPDVLMLTCYLCGCKSKNGFDLVESQVTFLYIKVCHISAYSETSGNLF